ncbi:cysteine--tRNA ligase [archaeon]|nr:cysteine--tRNA ligase [archaeon]
MKRKKQVFKLGHIKIVKLYTCGPTVYNYAHIGNFRAYLFYDILRRYLEYIGYEVKHVMNLTDVDDKTIRDSQKENMALKDFTQKYIDAFFNDIKILRIKPAHIYPKATDHINDMVDMIKKLMLRGYAYRGDDGSVYFSIKKFKNYGKLSKLKIKKLKAGARVSQDEYTKQEAKDFALWKAWIPEDGNIFWITPLGKGRPGWHIECSVMSQKYLQSINIHGGGVDLIFPHHENEIAQSECSSEKKFVDYWVHCNHLYVDGKKMSKSLGNFYTLRDILEKNYDPVAFRYLCLSTHYRSQLNFTFGSLEKAKTTVDNFNEFLRKLEWLQKEKSDVRPNHILHKLIKNTKEKFRNAMDNDLNTPQALASVFNLIKAVNIAIDKNTADKRTLQAVYKFLMEINDIFDIVEKESAEELTAEEKGLIEKREQLRKEKNFEEADKIRNALKNRGIILEDTPQGVMWKREK